MTGTRSAVSAAGSDEPTKYSRPAGAAPSAGTGVAKAIPTRYLSQRVDRSEQPGGPAARRLARGWGDAASRAPRQPVPRPGTSAALALPALPLAGSRRGSISPGSGGAGGRTAARTRTLRRSGRGGPGGATGLGRLPSATLGCPAPRSLALRGGPWADHAGRLGAASTGRAVAAAGSTGHGGGGGRGEEGGALAAGLETLTDGDVAGLPLLQQGEQRRGDEDRRVGAAGEADDQGEAEALQRRGAQDQRTH